jgi:hypothetical protein
MNRSKLPNGVLSRLVELDEQVEGLTRKLANTEQGIADARRRLSGGFRSEAEYDDLRAALKKMVDEQPALERRLHAAQLIRSRCKSWLDGLPPNTILEQVATDASGLDLEEVRAKLEAIHAELAALRAVPTPSEDIEQRIRHYVYSMARPQITGIGRGERLKVVWPGAGWDIKGPIGHRAEVLPMMALLFPDVMTAALMRDVERMANDPLPQAERKKRIAELESEIEQLAYVEEALVADAIARGEDVQRSPSAPPQAVLGVRAVEARRVTRAA